MTSYDIIIKPVLTEKSYDGVPNKKYTFKVNPKATKDQIKVAVEEVFKVKVQKINTISTKGKLRRQGRHQGYTPDTKKAVVWLTEDSKAIPFFESLA